MNKFTNNITTALTQNGAAAYSKTGSPLLDFFYNGPTCRNNTQKAQSLFAKAFAENPEIALKALFYIRNPRNGSGEKAVFLACLDVLKTLNNRAFNKAVSVLHEHGCWKDVFKIAAKYDDVFEAVSTKFLEDNEPSLFWKWLPSINAGKSAHVFAKKICKKFGITEKDYRLKCSAMRKDMPLVEQEMSAGNWSEIDYGKVPSVANRKYNGAFLKHDEERRRDFLGKVEKGEKKMHTGVLTPHQVWSMNNEAFWASRILTFPSLEGALPIIDRSGSMSAIVADKTSAKDIASAMGSMMAQKMKGDFKGLAIPFSRTARFVDVGETLYDAKKALSTFNEVANTNLQSVFTLILNHAKNYKVPQEDMPKVLVIFTDTEFDSIVDNHDSTNINAIKQKYEAAGYELPLIVFWNLVGSEQFPAKKDTGNTVLLSGYGPNSLSILKGELPETPYEAMIKVLSADWLSNVTLS